MGIDLGKIHLFPSAKLSCFHEASSIFVDGRSGSSIKLDAAYLDAVLVPRSEGQDQDIGDSESDRTSLRSNGYRSWPDEKRVELMLALT